MTSQVPDAVSPTDQSSYSPNSSSDRDRNPFAVAPGTVQVWLIDTRGWAGTELLRHWYTLLNPAEQERAARLRRASAQTEFIAGRAILRYMLAAGLSADDATNPARIPIEAEPFGKPRISNSFPAAAELPQFNVAHSHGLVLIALSHAGPVGVDIEFIDSTIDAIDVAQASFAFAEVTLVASAQTEAERHAVFYSLWTTKEAVAKADGRGLQTGFSSFSVAEPVKTFLQQADNAEECSLEIPAIDEGSSERRFYVRPLPVGGAADQMNYRAALATSRPRVPH